MGIGGSGLGVDEGVYEVTEMRRVKYTVPGSLGEARAGEHQYNIEAAGSLRGGRYVIGSATDNFGRSHSNSRNVAISDILLGKSHMLARTASHEFGHLAGLHHPAQPERSKNNLMTQTLYGQGRELTRRQLEQIARNKKFR